MPDKSPQLTQDFLDDFAATEENLQHKWSSVRFFKTFARNLQIYFIFFPINLKINHLLARIGAAFSVKKLNF